MKKAVQLRVQIVFLYSITELLNAALLLTFSHVSQNPQTGIYQGGDVILCIR